METLLDIERGRLIQFPVERAAAQPKLPMAKASLESSRGVTPMTMREIKWPTVCRHSWCSHEHCAVAKAHAALPCSNCQQQILPGEKFLVTAVEGKRPTAQEHFGTCPERTA